MSIVHINPKSAGDTLDYDVDFKSWLGSGDSVVDVTAIGSGVTVDAARTFGTIVKIWLSGGIDNTMAEVVVTVSSQAGRVKELTLQLRIGSW